MARVRMLTDSVTGEKYFQDVLTRKGFRRISAALVWPCGDRPGSLVVLGESRARENVLDGRHLVHFLDEVRHQDVKSLVDAMVRMTEDWMVRLWATPMIDGRVYLLDDANDEQRRLGRRQLRFGDPNGWRGHGEGLMPFYHALVQRRTKGEKTLFLGEKCTGADELGKLRADDMGKKPTDWPGAAALCFALAAFDLSTMPEWGERRTRVDCGPADSMGGY